MFNYKFFVFDTRIQKSTVHFFINLYIKKTIYFSCSYRGATQLGPPKVSFFDLQGKKKILESWKKYMLCMTLGHNLQGSATSGTPSGVKKKLVCGGPS
jgi:hypothetical protein